METVYYHKARPFGLKTLIEKILNNILNGDKLKKTYLGSTRPLPHYKIKLSVIFHQSEKK